MDTTSLLITPFVKERHIINAPSPLLVTAVDKSLKSKIPEPSKATGPAEITELEIPLRFCNDVLPANAPSPIVVRGTDFKSVRVSRLVQLAKA